MLDVTHSLLTPPLSATADGDASPFAAVDYDSHLTAELALTELTVESTGDVRRLRAAVEACFIALLLCDDSHTRNRFLAQLTHSLPKDQYRILPVRVPPTATRKQLTSLMAASAGLVEPEKVVGTRSPLLSAYDSWRRFEDDVVKSYGAGQRTLLVFDDAHLLIPAGLHLIHSLSNITAGDDLAVSLVLAAETAFAARLRRPAWRALASRTGAVVRFSR